jgi:excisionase family DNA binding protein
MLVAPWRATRIFLVTMVAPDLLQLEEVAQLARASVSTVRHWIRSGRLRSVRPGRRRLVPRADLDAFLARDVTAEWREAR